MAAAAAATMAIPRSAEPIRWLLRPRDTTGTPLGGTEHRIVGWSCTADFPLHSDMLTRYIDIDVDAGIEPILDNLDECVARVCPEWVDSRGDQFGGYYRPCSESYDDRCKVVGCSKHGQVVFASCGFDQETQELYACGNLGVLLQCPEHKQSFTYFIDSGT